MVIKLLTGFCAHNFLSVRVKKDLLFLYVTIANERRPGWVLGEDQDSKANKKRWIVQFGYDKVITKASVSEDNIVRFESGEQWVELKHKSRSNPKQDIKKKMESMAKQLKEAGI